MVKWWTQKIHVHELRELAREKIENGDEDGETLLAVLCGKKGKLNYIEAGGWNSDNNTQRVLSEAGSKILSQEW